MLVLLVEESAQELLQRVLLVLLVEESAQELLQRVRQELGLMQVLRRPR
jgi:uncharacterized protein YlzI (FlbEa/FlbD family)